MAAPDETDDALQQALQHFISSSGDDIYTLLDLPNGPQSTEKEIKRARRDTLLKFHPDKAKDLDGDAANDRFILRNRACDILSRQHLKEQYDNALRAREQKRARDDALTGEKRAMKADLLRRENAAKKRKYEVDDEAVELERLRRDGERKRKEYSEKLRRQAEEEERTMRQHSEPEMPHTNGSAQPQIQDIDRVVKCRFSTNEKTAHLSEGILANMFSRFGPVERVTVREKKVKVDGEKHRRAFMNVVVYFEKLSGAYAACSDFGELAQGDAAGDWQLFDQIPTWASGNEPSVLSQPSAGQESGAEASEILMIRLKIAEKKRRADKKKREEVEAAMATTDGDDRATAPPKRPAPNFGTFRGRAAAKGSDDGVERERKRELERQRVIAEMRREEDEEERRERERQREAV